MTYDGWNDDICKYGGGVLLYSPKN